MSHRRRHTMPTAAQSDSVIKRFCFGLRAKVCRRRTAIQPFRVIRVRPRAVFARNPRLQTRSTTAEGGRPFLKNAKSVKNDRSPRCRSRSTQERANDGPDNSAPYAPNSVNHLQGLFSRQVMYAGGGKAVTIGI